MSDLISHIRSNPIQQDQIWFDIWSDLITKTTLTPLLSLFEVAASTASLAASYYWIQLVVLLKFYTILNFLRDTGRRRVGLEDIVIFFELCALSRACRLHNIPLCTVDFTVDFSCNIPVIPLTSTACLHASAPALRSKMCLLFESSK